jgi:hypothetical protein
MEWEPGVVALRVTCQVSSHRPMNWGLKSIIMFVPRPLFPQASPSQWQSSRDSPAGLGELGTNPIN